MGFPAKILARLTRFQQRRRLLCTDHIRTICMGALRVQWRQPCAF